MAVELNHIHIFHKFAAHFMKESLSLGLKEELSSQTSTPGAGYFCI